MRCNSSVVVAETYSTQPVGITGSIPGGGTGYLGISQGKYVVTDAKGNVIKSFELSGPPSSVGYYAGLAQGQTPSQMDAARTEEQLNAVRERNAAYDSASRGDLTQLKNAGVSEDEYKQIALTAPKYDTAKPGAPYIEWSEKPALRQVTLTQSLLPQAPPPSAQATPGTLSAADKTKFSEQATYYDQVSVSRATGIPLPTVQANWAMYSSKLGPSSYTAKAAAGVSTLETKGKAYVPGFGDYKLQEPTGGLPVTITPRKEATKTFTSGPFAGPPTKTEVPVEFGPSNLTKLEKEKMSLAQPGAVGGYSTKTGFATYFSNQPQPSEQGNLNIPITQGEKSVASAYQTLEEAPGFSYVRGRAQYLAELKAPEWAGPAKPIFEVYYKTIAGFEMSPESTLKLPIAAAGVAGAGINYALGYDKQTFERGMTRSTIAVGEAITKPEFYVGAVVVTGLTAPSILKSTTTPKIPFWEISESKVSPTRFTRVNAEVTAQSGGNSLVEVTEYSSSGKPISQASYLFKSSSSELTKVYGLASPKEGGYSIVGDVQPALGKGYFSLYDKKAGVYAPIETPTAETSSLIMNKAIQDSQYLVKSDIAKTVNIAKAIATNKPYTAAGDKTLVYNPKDYYVGRSITPGTKSVSLIYDVTKGQKDYELFTVNTKTATGGKIVGSKAFVSLKTTPEIEPFAMVQKEGQTKTTTLRGGENVDVIGGAGEGTQKMTMQQKASIASQVAAQFTTPSQKTSVFSSQTVAHGIGAASMAQTFQVQKVQQPSLKTFNQKSFTNAIERPTMSLPQFQKPQQPTQVMQYETQIPTQRGFAITRQAPIEITLPRSLMITRPSEITRQPSIQIPKQINRMVQPDITRIAQPDITKTFEKQTTIQRTNLLETPTYIPKNPETPGPPPPPPPLVPSVPKIPFGGGFFQFPSSGGPGPANPKGTKGRYNPSMVARLFDITKKGKAPTALSKEFNIRPIYTGKAVKQPRVPNPAKMQPMKPFKPMSWGEEKKKR